VFKFILPSPTKGTEFSIAFVTLIPKCTTFTRFTVSTVDRMNDKAKNSLRYFSFLYECGKHIRPSAD
jgi:hypothetical protein